MTAYTVKTQTGKTFKMDVENQFTEAVNEYIIAFFNMRKKFKKIIPGTTWPSDNNIRRGKAKKSIKNFVKLEKQKTLLWNDLLGKDLLDEKNETKIKKVQAAEKKIFGEDLENFAEEIKKLKENMNNNEAIKNSLINLRKLEANIMGTKTEKKIKELKKFIKLKKELEEIKLKKELEEKKLHMSGGAKHKKTKRRTKRMRKSMRKTKRRHKSKKRRKTKRRRRKR